MPYKQTNTPCVVRLIPLRGLAPALLAQCQALRAEAGRLWTDLVTLHAQARAGTLAQRRRVAAGDQRRPVRPAQPERAGALPEVRRQCCHRHRAPRAGTG
jgi:hypothetical protein